MPAPRKTMTSANTALSNAIISDGPEQKDTRRTADVQIQSGLFKPHDQLDHGLEDHDWHYLWVNVDDKVQVGNLYQNDYRFVSYSDVEDRLKADDRRAFLFTPDVNNRVGYDDQLRLMRISQRLYKLRYQEGIAAISGDPVQRATEQFEASIEDSMYHDPAWNKVTPQNVRVSQDRGHGELADAVAQ